MGRPVLIIHGGAGPLPSNPQKRAKLHRSLVRILSEAWRVLERGGTAESAVVTAVSLLEDDPLFNAGKGSKCQRDGKIRMSASLMSGSRLRFSGVVNIMGISNPVQVARKLASKTDRVLAGVGARAFALKNGVRAGSPYLKPHRPRRGKTGTVGAVALDKKGHLAAATSTGGRYSAVGRVSDSCTVAGNYANACAGVSATGIGEQIVEHALAATVVTRVTDGVKLSKALGKSFARVKAMKHQMGCIAIGRNGEVQAVHSTPGMAWASRTLKAVKVCPPTGRPRKP